jgi:glycosyltransferase involved in cell wall biosynthesis
MNNQISIIIPSYKNPKCLEICLDSGLLGETNKNQYIVVLDGFAEQYTSLKKKYNNTNVQFYEFEENQGMQQALNVGVFHATNEKILIVNDDNVFPVEWDKILLEDFHHDTIITPNQIERNPSIFNFGIGDFGGPDNFRYKEFSEKEPSYRSNQLTQDGEIFPFFMTKKDYMTVGGFDTIFNSPFICDWDFFLKLELINKKFLRSRKLNFYHFGSVSTKNGSERDKFNESERNAAEIFYYKWGFHATRHPKTNSHKPMEKFVNGITF